ncbi:MAG: CYTH domain-containing protein [Candidatus Woesearchaeota archaeon]
MKHGDIKTRINEFVLDNGEELISKNLMLAIRDIDHGAIVVLKDVRDSIASFLKNTVGFKTDSFGSALSLFENLGYEVVGGSLYGKDASVLEAKKNKPIELEAKVEVSRKKFSQIQHRLLGRGTCVASVTEKNYLFDKGEELESRGSLLRLRVEEVMFSNEKNMRKKYRLTYKGPREESELNKRVEIEIDVNKPLEASKLLEMLGYEKAGCYHKKREIHDFGETKVFLDQACKSERLFISGQEIWEDDIGKMPPVSEWRTFVEVEGPNEKAIKKTLWWDLGIWFYKNIKQSYIDIL